MRVCKYCVYLLARRFYKNLYIKHVNYMLKPFISLPIFCLFDQSISGCILSPCLFNLYAEYLTRNAGLEEKQTGIKIAGRNINNLRYADDTTLMAESEELKSLLKKVKEESEKVGLKLNIHKTKIMASSPIMRGK